MGKNIKTYFVLGCFTIPSPRPSNAWLFVDSMAVTRVFHASTFIVQDNSVLITGGSDGYSIFSSVQKYIPSTGCFQTMRNMPRTRYMHTADQLTALSGYVVISGGYGALGAISVADLYHPITGDILTIPLTLPRYRHTSVVLSSSQLVLIGGLTTAGVYTASSDMIDIASNSSFVPGANTMTEARVYHAATLLGNNSGVVLITGGLQPSGAYMATAYLYQGSWNNFLSLGSGVTMTPALGSHSATYLPPPINKVLIVGGATNVVYGTISLFDVNSLTFTTLTSTLIYPRNLHTATLLPNGKVLIVGGSNGGSLKTCELIDPSNNYTVTAAASLNTNRYYHTANLLPDSNNGTVLVCGGYNLLAAALNTCELYFV